MEHENATLLSTTVGTQCRCLASILKMSGVCINPNAYPSTRQLAEAYLAIRPANSPGLSLNRSSLIYHRLFRLPTLAPAANARLHRPFFWGCLRSRSLSEIVNLRGRRDRLPTLHT